MKRIITIYLIFLIIMSTVGCGNNNMGKAVFNTENVKSVTFFSPAVREGALVPEEELSEIIEWLGTFTVGEKAGKQLDPGTNSISVCIEYADGTILEQGLSTTKIGYQAYYMNFADAPECYLKIVNPEPASDKWDCTVTCAETSNNDSYVITYSNEEIVADTGIITIQNRNSFDIVAHLLTEGEEERVAEVKSGGVTVLHQINKELIYTAGFHADVDEGTEINIMVYDGEWSEPYM